MRSSLKELLILVSGIAIVALCWHESLSTTFTSTTPTLSAPLAITESFRDLPLPEGRLSIGGISLGMPRAEVESIYGAPLSHSGTGPTYQYAGIKSTWGAGGFVYINFGKDDKVLSVSGGSLLFEMTPILTSHPSPADVRRFFGAPDRVGWAGFGMCEGPFAGYSYDELGLTVTFSQTLESNVELSSVPSKLKSDSEYFAKDVTRYPADLCLENYFKHWWGSPQLAVPKPMSVVSNQSQETVQFPGSLLSSNNSDIKQSEG